MLPQQRFGSLLRQVSVVAVEGGRAERVHHFEDAHVHPGTAASVGVLWTGKDPLGDAAEVEDPLAAGVLGLQEVRVRGVHRAVLMDGRRTLGCLGGRGVSHDGFLGARLWGRVGWCGHAHRSLSSLGDWRVRWVVEAASQVEGVVVVERLARAASPFEDVEAVSPGGVGWDGRMRRFRGVVVESTAKTEGVIVVHVVRAVVVVSGGSFEETRSIFVGKRYLAAGGLGAAAARGSEG